jgi:trehalose synthase
MMKETKDIVRTFKPLPNGVVYSKRENFTPFSAAPAEAYESIVGAERIERLYNAAARLKGVKLMELNSTAQGGGVAEMLFSQLPFINSLDIKEEWKVIRGNERFFECTKKLHNLLQGMEGAFSPDMEDAYCSNMEVCACDNLIDYPDVVTVHDPQPLGLAHHVKRPEEAWMWRCHIDIENPTFKENPGLWNFMTGWMEHYDAAIFSASHYVVSLWPIPSFIIPPYIDPLSEKNRELTEEEIDAVLTRYGIDRRTPIIAQIGRFDPWKGIDRTIATFRHVRKETGCQLIIAGGLATDDPEGARVLARVQEQTKKDEDIHILNLSLQNRLENWKEINAMQRAATIVMQPSTREGFGLVVTEALWKSKPVIASQVGAIPLQIREGDTGYFYDGAKSTARKVLSLLKNPAKAEAMGTRARQYVTDHFLMPDRIADYLKTIDITMNGVRAKDMPRDCIISFHPWFKLAKRLPERHH